MIFIFELLNILAEYQQYNFVVFCIFYCLQCPSQATGTIIL